MAHGSVEFCEATHFDLVDKSKESLSGRETDRDLRSTCRCVTGFYLCSPNEQRGGCAARIFLMFSFPCSADQERDCPPYKVVFSGWKSIP